MQITPNFIKLIFKNYPNILKMIDNFSWLFYDKLLRIILGLFVAALVARYLGPEKFGIFNYAASYVSIFAALASFGLGGILVRELINKENLSNVIMGTSIFLYIFGGIIVTILSTILIIFINPDDILLRILVLIMSTALIFRFNEVIKYWFESKVLSKYVVWFDNGAYIISSIIKIFLVIYKAELIYFAWVVLIEGILITIGLVIIFNYKYPNQIKKFRFNYFVGKNLLRDSWPMIFSGIILMVQARIDQLMLGIFIGAREVGYYSVSLQILEGLSFLPMIIMSTMRPSILEGGNISTKLYNDRLYNYYRLSFIISILTIVPIFLFSNQIIYLLFGSEYYVSGFLLAVMSFRLIFANMGVARGVHLLKENLLTYSMWTMFIGTLVNIILNYLLIPNYASLGAIIASYISFSITIFVIDFFYFKTNENTKLMFKSIFTFYKFKINSFG